MSLSHLVGVVGLATMVLITGVVRADKPIGKTLKESLLCQDYPQVCRGQAIVWVLDDISLDVCHAVLDRVRTGSRGDSTVFAVIYRGSIPEGVEDHFRRQRTRPLLLSAASLALPRAVVSVPGRAYELLDGVVSDSIRARK